MKINQQIEWSTIYLGEMINLLFEKLSVQDYNVKVKSMILLKNC